MSEVNPKSQSPRSTPPATPAVEVPSTMEQAMATIAQLLERQTTLNEFQQKNAPRRKKTMAEYLREKPRKRLLRQTFQNGREVNPSGLSDATIKKLDTIAAGQYAENTITVVRIGEGPHSRIHIMYSNKFEQQRMLVYMKFPSFTKMVDAIAAEMAARGVKPVMDPVADPVEEDTPDE